VISKKIKRSSTKFSARIISNLPEFISSGELPLVSYAYAMKSKFQYFFMTVMVIQTVLLILFCQSTGIIKS